MRGREVFSALSVPVRGDKTHEQTCSVPTRFVGRASVASSSRRLCLETRRLPLTCLLARPFGSHYNGHFISEEEEYKQSGESSLLRTLLYHTRAAVYCTKTRVLLLDKRSRHWPWAWAWACGHDPFCSMEWVARRILPAMPFRNT